MVLLDHISYLPSSSRNVPSFSEVEFRLLLASHTLMLTKSLMALLQGASLNSILLNLHKNKLVLQAFLLHQLSTSEFYEMIICSSSCQLKSKHLPEEKLKENLKY